MCDSASTSLKARPRSSGAVCRIDDGSVCPISSPRLFAPTLSSIAWMSRGEGPICRRTKSVAAAAVVLSGAFMGFSSGRVLGIGGFIHQAAEFAFVRNLELEEPCLAAGVGIYQRGLG